MWHIEMKELIIKNATLRIKRLFITSLSREDSNLLWLFSQSSSDFLWSGEFLLEELLNIEVESGVERAVVVVLLLVMPGHGATPSWGWTVDRLVGGGSNTPGISRLVPRGLLRGGQGNPVAEVHQVGVCLGHLQHRMEESPGYQTYNSIMHSMIWI